MATDLTRPLRILAADDSTVMRSVLRTMFELHGADLSSGLPPMELCGLVPDGLACLEAVERLRPDAILLDLEMPRLDGLGVLKRLCTIAPDIPVILCSASTERGARSTLDALALGAKDYVMKPSSRSDFAAAMDSLMSQLLPKIAALSRRWCAPVPSSAAVSAVPLHGGNIELVVIGVSTGGPSALESMLPLLPSDFPVPVMIVQHMPRLFTGALAVRLHRLCRMPVSEARDGTALVPGCVVLAPGDAHMEVQPGVRAQPSRVRLHHGPPLNSCTPSVDYLFQSAARAHGAATLAVMMTGMGSDGLDGTRAVKAAGGLVFAQDQGSSAVWGMPGRVVQAGLADRTLPLSGIARAIQESVARPLVCVTSVPTQLLQTPYRSEAPYGVL